MIKNIAYYPSQCALNSRPVMSAVLDVFQSRGIQTQENSLNADAAVIWSVLWHGRMRKNQQVYEHYRRQGKPVVVIDVGALYRGRTWKLAVNHINQTGYYGHTENLDRNRPTKLGISTAINLTNNGEILVAAQHNSSLQVAPVGIIESWITDQVEQIRRVTDRPIVIRPHPRCRVDLSKVPRNMRIEQPVAVANTYDSFNIHYDYHAVVNYNSGPGIQAAISGARPIVDQSSLAWPVAVSIADIDHPYEIDRQQWLIEICHTEYTLDELKLGLWLQRIAPALM